MNKLILPAATLVIGLAVGYKLAYTPPKEQSTAQTENTNNVTTVIKEIVKPGGEVIKETTIVDKSVEKKKESVVKIEAAPKYLLSVGYTSDKDYLFGASYAVLKNVYIGAQYNTAGNAAVTLSVAF
jgi:hypothetical protein